METEQRYVVSYLNRKGLKLPQVVAELASVHQEKAATKTASITDYTSSGYIVSI
jgi:hypothetical protein